jgi:hypothetical protein
MTHFKDERELPSTKVTKELLKSLEQYIITRGLFGKKNVSITDGTRTETIETIDDFVQAKFSSTTKSIEFSYMGTVPPVFHIMVRFETDRHFSKIYVEYEGPVAQEVGRGVVSNMLDCLAPYTTSNKWFHPDMATKTALAFILVVVMFVWLKGVVAPPPLVPYIGGVWLCGIMYVFVCPWFKPYTTFDSPLSDKKDVWWKYMWGWFVVIAGVSSWAKDHMTYWLTKAGWLLFK